MNTTVVRTAKGKTIMIQHDVSSPRVYSRIHLISGTKGAALKYPEPRINFGHEKWQSEEEMKKLKGLDVLVINALREEPHHSHFSLQDALEFIEEVKPKRSYLTHISHNLGFHEQVQAELPKNVFLAYDNLKISI